MLVGKKLLFQACDAALSAMSSSGDRIAFFVPGRIEVLGKHTDYAGGRSLLCAIDRGFAVRVVPRADSRIRVADVARNDVRELALHPDVAAEQGHWSAYVATVAQRIARDFPCARYGADIAFLSDLPAASGMSSSSALVIAAFLALSEANHLDNDATYRQVITSREVLGNYLGAVENGRAFGGFAAGAGVGTLGGSQDQTAILCCRAGALSQYAFCPVRSEGHIDFPADRAFIVAYSGVAAEKTASAMLRYNRVSLAAVEILRCCNEAAGRHDASLGDAVASAESHDQIRGWIRSSSAAGFTVQQLMDRFEQFVAEAYDIIPNAARALQHGDLVDFGTLVDRSQRGAESLLGNQVPETMFLARTARQLGADAASAFGAGFGGSVWALVAAEVAETFAAQWSAIYAQQFPEAAKLSEFIVTRPGPPARRL